MKIITDILCWLGEGFLHWLTVLGDLALFVISILRYSAALAVKPMLSIRALFFVGVLSLPIIVVAGFFVGMVLSFQGYTTLTKFGAEQSLGIVVALPLMRELGPVVAALLFVGRAGSAVTAEIGLMKTTEQLAAMEMMAIEPVAQVAVPRFWAMLCSLPLLTILFVAVAIIGAYLIGVTHLGVDAGVFWSQMQNGVDFYADIGAMLVKSLVFGWIVASVSLYQGFTCLPTAAGIGKATTATVVFASLAVLGLDFVLTAMMFGG